MAESLKVVGLARVDSRVLTGRFLPLQRRLPETAVRRTSAGAVSYAGGQYSKT